jgi:hypothetical protein
MDAACLLWHVHEEPEREEDAKLIGVYRTEDDASAAIERLRGRPGVRRFPTGFQIERYALNVDHWTDGFVTAVIERDGTITYEHE